jgi:hypothetical protein
MFQRNAGEPQLSVQKQLKEIDTKPRVLRKGNVGSSIANVEVLHRDGQTRKDRDPESAFDADVDSEYTRGRCFQPALVLVRVDEGSQRDRANDEEDYESTGNEQGYSERL